MSSSVSHRAVSRLFSFAPKVGVRVPVRSEFKQCKNKLHTSSSLIFAQRSEGQLHQNCRAVTSIPLTITNQVTQKRYFTASRRHFVNRSVFLHSSKTSRKSASVIATSPSEAKEYPDIQSSQLQQRYIYVHTSVNRWEDVPGGLVFDTAYLDSQPDDQVNQAVPLVVSLHNTPGSFHDMRPILEAFAKSGCRVLAPAFPGTGHTEGVLNSYNDVFTHTTSEKAEFVRDFLVTLDVKKVDLLIGHGCGCYPAMRLAAGRDTSSMFKSTAFLSPWPHRDFKGTSQRNLIPLLHDMWERPYYRSMARALSRFVVNTPTNTTALERIVMVYTLYNLNFGEVGGFGIALDSVKFPRVMFFAEDDPFVDADLSYELADMMGIGADSTHHFSGQLERGKMDQFPSCLVFDKGGQHIHTKQSGAITAVLFNLLKSVRPGFLAV